MLLDILKKDSMVERDYILLNEEKIYVWFEIYEDGYKDGNIIQNFIPSYITFTYQDLEYNFKEKEIKAYKEYLKEDGTWETVFINTYIITDINQNDTTEEITVKGFDLGLKYTEAYESNLDYSAGNVTMQMASDEINTKLGMNLATLDINGDFILDSDQFSGTGQSNGNVIKFFAGMSGNRAIIIQDKLVYSFVNETTKTLLKGEYTELEDKRDTHPITIVVLGQESIQGQEAVRRDEDLISLYGENYLRINDNPIAYTIEKRELLIDAIFNKVKGFGYSSFVAKETNRMDLNIGDVFQFENSEGVMTKSIILRKTITGTEIQLEAPSVTSASINYTRPTSAIEVAKRAEIIANQAENQVTIVVENVTTIENGLDSLELEINNTYQDLNTKLESYATDDSLFEVANRVEQLQTSQDITFSIVEDIKDNGVSIVRTETNVVVDKNGVSVDTSDAPTSSNLNSNGIIIYDKTSGSNTELLFAGYDATIGQSQVRTANLSVSRYFEMGNNTRFEDYQREGENPGTGVFYKGKK